MDNCAIYMIINNRISTKEKHLLDIMFNLLKWQDIDLQNTIRNKKFSEIVIFILNCVDRIYYS